MEMLLPSPQDTGDNCDEGLFRSFLVPDNPIHPCLLTPYSPYIRTPSLMYVLYVLMFIDKGIREYPAAGLVWSFKIILLLHLRVVFISSFLPPITPICSTYTDAHL